MRLYFIKRVSDGKFLGNINGNYSVKTGKLEVYWADKPQMFLKTPEGIAGNLRKLCSEPYYSNLAPPKVHPRVAQGWRELCWKGFDAAKLQEFSVVSMDVEILSMKATPANEFIQVDAIANHPLSSIEKDAA